MLDKIKSIVGVELANDVKLSELILENGTVLLAEAFEAGNSIFIKTEEEQIALPVGEYTLADGKVLIVEQEGVIKEIMTAKVEAAEEAITEEVKEELAEFDPERYVTVEDWRGMEERIANLEDAIADLKADKEPKEEKVEESAQLEKQELSNIEPIKHNPETKADSIFNLKKTSYPKTLQNRVYEKLN